MAFLAMVLHHSMPAASLAVNWDAVRAHALHHGVRQSARDFNLPEETVKKRCTREGWLSPQPRPQGLTDAAMARISSPSVPKASVAAQTALERLGSKSKLYTAKWGVHATGHAKTLRGEAALAAAPAMQATTRTLLNAQLPGWIQVQDGTNLHLHLHRGSGPEDVPAKVLNV